MGSAGSHGNESLFFPPRDETAPLETLLVSFASCPWKADFPLEFDFNRDFLDFNRDFLDFNGDFLDFNGDFLDGCRNSVLSFPWPLGSWEASGSDET